MTGTAWTAILEFLSKAPSLLLATNVHASGFTIIKIRVAKE